MEFDVVIDERSQWMLSLLGLLLPQSVRVLPLRGGTWVRAERMLIATKSALGEFVHPGLLATLRGAAAGLAGRSSLPRKLFISRADTVNRTYLHEGAIAERFQRQGFTPVKLATLSVQDQLLAFREATHVAGLHGGGLANLVWGQESIDVFELYLLSHYNSCYSSLCFSLGHPYRNRRLSEEGAPPDLTGAFRTDRPSGGADDDRPA
jgi:capsular polysaccharide biosynthesis protein